VAGSVIRMTGAILGLKLSVEEVVTVHEPPHRKAWQTIGAPRLLIVGRYRMGFDIAPAGRGSQVTVFIDYDLPCGLSGHLLGRLFGRMYARWCVRTMPADAATGYD